MKPAAAVLAASAAWAVAACAGPAPAGGGPDWRGAPVHLRHLGDGGVEAEFMAPTGGHTWSLADVAREPARVVLTFAHQGPAADQFVAQVVTPLRVNVPADVLGDAAIVEVRIRDGARTALALVASRPR